MKEFLAFGLDYNINSGQGWLVWPMSPRSAGLYSHSLFPRLARSTLKPGTPHLWWPSPLLSSPLHHPPTLYASLPLPPQPPPPPLHPPLSHPSSFPSSSPSPRRGGHTQSLSFFVGAHPSAPIRHTGNHPSHGRLSPPHPFLSSFATPPSSSLAHPSPHICCVALP